MAAGRAAQIFRHRGCVAAAMFAMLCTAPAAEVHAACRTVAYPSRPIRMVVPFSPGGTSDTLARILGQKITEAWGQQVVVDGRPGASGIIGTEVAARAPADGYTLMHGNLSQFAHQSQSLQQIELRHVARFRAVKPGRQRAAIARRESGGACKVGGRIDPARESQARHVQLRLGRRGTLAYIGGEMFKSMAGIDIVHISYKGTVLALNDLVGGQLQLMFSDMPIALPHARSGKLRALAVTGARRTPLVPEIPTVAEAGMPGYALDNWWGISGAAWCAAGPRRQAQCADRAHTRAR